MNRQETVFWQYCTINGKCWQTYFENKNSDVFLNFPALLSPKAFCNVVEFLECRVLKMLRNDVKYTHRKPNSRNIEAPGKVCSYNYQHSVILISWPPMSRLFSVYCLAARVSGRTGIVDWCLSVPPLSLLRTSDSTIGPGAALRTKTRFYTL